MSEPLTFQYEFTDAVATRATPTRGLNARFLRALPAVLLMNFATGALLAVERLWNPKQPSVGYAEILMLAAAGFLGLMIVLQGLALAAVWRMRRRLQQWGSSLHDRTIRWTFADDAIHVQSSTSERHISWSDVRQLRISADFWTLRLINGPDLLLPIEHLTDAIRDRIRTRTAGVETIQSRL